MELLYRRGHRLKSRDLATYRAPSVSVSANQQSIESVTVGSLTLRHFANRYPQKQLESRPHSEKYPYLVTKPVNRSATRRPPGRPGRVIGSPCWPSRGTYSVISSRCSCWPLQEGQGIVRRDSEAMGCTVRGSAGRRG